MSQMTAADQAEVKALRGNDKCAECGMKNAQWASVSFGTVFCLECSGVHRSLGVHISFVRSIAMDSWTPAQLALMKAGGNARCSSFLSGRGILPSTPIRQKYESDAAQLYKLVLKARVDGLPEPTHLPPPPPAKAPQSASRKEEDSNGMEPLAGESDSAYAARQLRLRNEAKARLAAKFSNSGATMTGIGSDAAYNPHAKPAAIADTLFSGLGTAWSSLTLATSKAGAVLADDNAVHAVKNTGINLWSSLTSAASDVAKTLTTEQDHDDDGLVSFQRQMQSQRTGKYTGFGYDDSTRDTHSTPGHCDNNEAVGMPGEDVNGMQRLTGESDNRYIQRQTRLRDEAKARMAAKFGTGGKMTSVGSSMQGGFMGNSSNVGISSSLARSTDHNNTATYSGNLLGDNTMGSMPSSAPPSGGHLRMQEPPKSAPVFLTSKPLNATKVKVESSEDFFSSFGA